MRYTALAVLFGALWAGAFAAVKIALASSPPLFLMAVRFLAEGLLLHGDARRASAHCSLNPVVRLALGTLFLGEALRSGDVAGSALVAAGMYLVQRS